jgi:hypothetical protein
MAQFNITIGCNFEEWWRYNIIAVCEACYTNGERAEFSSQESIIADIGAELNECPDIYPKDRTLHFTTESGDYLNLLIYVIPHTSAKAKHIGVTDTFPLSIEVKVGKRVILREECEVNLWAGSTISLLEVGKEQ